MKPIRTALFVPGNRKERVEKAINLEADAVIIDLEDSVPISEKESTRALVRAFLEGHSGKRTYVRINALSTSYGQEDLKSVVCKNISGVVLPKVESSEDIFEIDNLLTKLEEKAGIPLGTIEVIPQCETARGIIEAYKIASARPEHHRVLTLTFGAADYTLDLGISITRDGRELEYPRSYLPIACRAGRVLPPLDTPWMTDISDIEGLVADAKKAKQYGFMGKLVIHPNQIKPCNEIFSPAVDEIIYAKKVLEAFEKAEKEGKAAIQLNGKFIDYPVVEKYKRIIALAELYGLS